MVSYQLIVPYHAKLTTHQDIQISEGLYKESLDGRPDKRSATDLAEFIECGGDILPLPLPPVGVSSKLNRDWAMCFDEGVRALGVLNCGGRGGGG